MKNKYTAVITALALWGLGGLTACSLPPGAAAAPTGPQVTRTAEHLELSVDGRPVLRYQLTPRLPEGVEEAYRRSGFIHPVYAPDGFVVTDDFPVDHAHQHGVFTAWTKARFRGEPIDFWNQLKGTGNVEHVAVLETERNDSTAGFRVKLAHTSASHGTVLDEEWHVRVHAGADPFRWDLRSVQTNVSTDTLFLEQHIYGGLGVRGSRRWNGKDSLHYANEARFRTSEGLDRLPANHTRPAWTEIYGDSARLRVTPSAANFRAPQFVRVHPEMPYLSVTPVVEEGFYIAPGGVYESTYAFEVGNR